MQLAPPFSDHCVLQRDSHIPVWGTTVPGGAVRVELGGVASRVSADSDGRWLVRLPPLPAGGPHRLVATGPDGEVVLEDVLIGEVWVCSGQSNMQWSLENCGDTDAIRDGGELDRVRLLRVDTPAQLGRQTAVGGTWQRCDERSLAAFSAVGAWFGRRLTTALDVPIGLIANAWGGTRVQAWMSREALALDPCGRDELAYYESSLFADDDLSEPVATALEWERKAAPHDAGNRGLAEGWAEAGFDDSDWDTMPVPSHWQQHGHPGSGVFWFRRRVELPAAWAGRELQLDLGAIDKHDDSYVGGQRVGGLSWEDGPEVWKTQRCYRVPAELVHDGAITIAVRARSHAFHGGMWGPKPALRVHPVGDDSEAIPLAGDWRYRIEQDWGMVTIPPPPFGHGNPNSPHILFDSRVHPLLPYAIAGVIWYQGESNAAEAERYARMLPAMIRDWRRAWGQGDVPFYQVQLANFREPIPEPAPSDWAELRDAQVRAAAAVPKGGFAVAIDVGEADDIHPRDKRSVGERLARLALADHYGHDLVPGGPIFRDARFEAGGRVRIRFDHAAGLATRDGGAVRQVSIAGNDRRFRWAEAAIEGETLVVSSPEVPRPAAVRYAWADNPVDANLVNGENLPASPFRSDNW